MPGKLRDKQIITIAERKQHALDFRKSGKSFRAIAVELDVSPAQAYQDVRSALADVIAAGRENAEQLRDLEVERLDALLDALWEQATSPGVKGQTFAVDRVLSIMERRSRLLGLDAPVKSQQENSGSTTIRVEYVDTDTPGASVDAPGDE